MDISAKKVFSSFSWVALISYANRFLGFVTTLILAKFLDPKDFGLVAIASMVIEVLKIFKDLGLSEALIYKKEQIEEASNTAYFLIVGFHIVLFILASIVSHFAGNFYNNSLVMPIIIVMSSNLVWDSLRAIPRALLRKNIEFKKLVMPEVLPVLVASVVSLVMAFTGFGVWSLVVRTVLHSILGMILLGRIYPYKPTFNFNIGIAKELFHYGKFIMATSMMLVILYNIDKFYVSKFSGIEFLGFYELAMRISDLPVKELSHVIGSVMFPVFSKMNNKLDQFKNAFMTTLKYVCTISIPMSLGISIYGPYLVTRIYGEKWIPLSKPLQILALYALFRSMSSIIHDAFKALGRPEYMQKYVFVKLLLISILGIPSLKFFNLEGICYLIVLVYAFTFIFEVITLSELISFKFSELVRTIFNPLLLSIILIPGIFVSFKFIFLKLELHTIFFSIFLTILTYFFILIKLDKSIVLNFKKLIVTN